LDKVNYYTKSEVDSNLSNYYLKSNPNNYLNTSTDSWAGNYTNYYNKSQIDTNLSLYYLLSNPSNYFNLTTSYNKTQIDNNLSLYYLATNPNAYVNITSISNSTIARIGNCSSGKVVMNVTNLGVQCVTPTAVETEPAWNGNYTIFTGLINNESYLSTYNSTYHNYAVLNQSNSTAFMPDWNYNVLSVKGDFPSIADQYFPTQAKMSKKAYIVFTNATAVYFTTYTFNSGAIINSISPIGNFNSSSVTFNVSTNINVSWCGVSINGSSNYVMTINSSKTGASYTNSSIADGNYNYIVTCNDTNDTYNSFSNSNVNYFLIDTVIPTINVTYPVNSSYYNSSSVLFNVSSSEIGTGSIIPDIDGSLVSWWRMDDVNATTGVIDYMGRNNGTRVNAVQTDAGKMGKGESFDGDGDYIEPKINPLMNQSLLTVSLWAKASKATIGGDEIVITDTPGGGWYSISLMRRTNNLYQLYMGNQSTVVSVQSVTPANTVNWVNLIGVYNGTIVSLYVNGILEGTPASLIGKTYIYSNPSLQVLNIGGRGGGWNGTIDDVMIFNRSLSSDEILSIYNATKYQHTENLNDGSHTFKAYTQDLAGNVNMNGTIYFNVNTTGGAPSNCWTKTGTGRGSILFIPRGCVYNISKGSVG